MRNASTSSLANSDDALRFQSIEIGLYRKSKRKGGRAQSFSRFLFCLLFPPGDVRAFSHQRPPPSLGSSFFRVECSACVCCPFLPPLLVLRTQIIKAEAMRSPSPPFNPSDPRAPHRSPPTLFVFRLPARRVAARTSPGMGEKPRAKPL